jgi:hypothetical protein
MMNCVDEKNKKSMDLEKQNKWSMPLIKKKYYLEEDSDRGVERCGFLIWRNTLKNALTSFEILKRLQEGKEARLIRFFEEVNSINERTPKSKKT